MVSDIPKKVVQIRELVRVIDRPVDQVIIEARIVIATETFAREVGAKFGINGATGKDGDRSSLGFGGADTASSGNAITRGNNPNTRGAITRNLNVDLGVQNPAGALALSILNAGYLLDVELSAMQEEGRGEVISNPRVVTSNQREAVIRQGQEVGYVTVTQGAGAVQFKDVLLEMKVTPTITNDGRVFLNMNVKKDEVEDFVEASIGSVPLINKREVNTAVLIEDGQTVVIGGVYEFRDRSDIQKVPFLGDIPFLGNLFKKKGKNKEKAELLIFVTPKVLQVSQR
jgi:type IV pilus assembly protein PilQ